MSLTFDRRTLVGVDAISRAWRILSPEKQPRDFTLADKSNEFLDTEAAFVRMSPGLATLDVPFTFTTDRPPARNVALAKLIPVGEGEKRHWKIWVLSTAMRCLLHYPFQPLPLLGYSDVIPFQQRGIPKAQGLPSIQEDIVLDAIIVGGSTSGLTNLVRLESIGANVLAFSSEPHVGWQWVEARYDGLTTHNPRVVLQLPGFSFQDAHGEYGDPVTAEELGRYYASAVKRLQLAVFYGVRVVGNHWDHGEKLWRVTVHDVRTKNAGVFKARTLVLSNGWAMQSERPFVPELRTRERFQGLMKHSVHYKDATEFEGKKVVVVGAGASGHDVAHSLAVGGAESVTLIQRSPIVLLEYEVIVPLLYNRYLVGEMSQDTIHFMELGMPTGLARKLAKGRFAALVASQKETNKRLEEKGYVQNYSPDYMALQLEQKGQGLYFDQPGTFALVLGGKIKVEQGNVVGCEGKGVVVRNMKTGDERVVEAEAVVFATGYEMVDLNQHYERTGFLDQESARRIENVSLAGVDDEGEMLGYSAYSGHPNLYFSGANAALTKWMSTFVALQVMAQARGEFPGRYQEYERYPDNTPRG